LIQLREDYNIQDRDQALQGAGWNDADLRAQEIRRQLSQELETTLDTFINTGQRQEAYVGTPDAGTPALETFYTTIYQWLVPCFLKKARNDGSEAKRESMIRLLRAASHCGPRSYDTAIKEYQARVLGRKANCNDQFYDLLSEIGASLQSQECPPPSNESIVYHSKFMHALGKEFGHSRK